PATAASVVPDSCSPLRQVGDPRSTELKRGRANEAVRKCLINGNVSRRAAAAVVPPGSGQCRFAECCERCPLTRSRSSKPPSGVSVSWFGRPHGELETI